MDSDERLTWWGAFVAAVLIALVIGSCAKRYNHEVTERCKALASVSPQDPVATYTVCGDR